MASENSFFFNERLAKSTDAQTISQELSDLISLDAHWRNNSINLNAAENYTSPLVKKIIGLHPSYDQYQFPPTGGFIEAPGQFSGGLFFTQIREHINMLGAELLECPYINPNPKGGQAAEIAVMLGLVDKDDQIFFVQDVDGGHYGLDYLSERLGIVMHPLVFDHASFQINVDESLTAMKKIWATTKSRKLVMIEQSFILRQQPLNEFAQKIKNEFPDVIISYDVSHVLGLIVGKQFSNPITEGIDLIHGSTHKTFPGPQKGIIAFPEKFDEQLRQNIHRAVSPGLQSNSGTSEIVALAVALEEMKVFGEDYARALCANAKHMARGLDELGMPVAGKHFDFTETHQVWLLIGNKNQAWEACGKLHRAGIRTTPLYLPHLKTNGLRLGLGAITRLGFAQNEIKLIAHWIAQILNDDYLIDTVAKKIKDLLNNFPMQSMLYQLEELPMKGHVKFQGEQKYETS